jgi:ATP-dependent helicase HrpA
VPETVKQCLEIEPDFKGTVQEWLGNRLRKLTGEAIPLNVWGLETLPEHLRMNFRVIDEQGQMLDYGRDLKKLQDKYAVKAGKSFDQIAADELNYTGCIQWAFDDLPPTYSFTQNGQTFVGFPAIVDEGDTVGVRIFDTEAKAANTHREGLIRLLQLQLRKDCTYLLKTMPLSAAAEFAYNRLPPHPILVNDGYGKTSFKVDLLYSILYSVFLDGRTIRTQEAFEQMLRENKTQLISTANEVGKIALEIMALFGELKMALGRLNMQDARFTDISEQLELLVYSGFIRNTSAQQLKAIPRYLKAINYRFEKPDNDGQKIQEINRYSTRYWKEVEKKSKKDRLIPEQDPFRWMLEEFRVSLFAQQLKTAYPVSAKRLDKAWDERG